MQMLPGFHFFYIGREVSQKKERTSIFSIHKKLIKNSKTRNTMESIEALVICSIPKSVARAVEWVGIIPFTNFPKHLDWYIPPPLSFSYTTQTLILVMYITSYLYLQQAI